MDTLLQDLRFALRTLVKAKSFTAIAVMCLALGIAANVTVFTPVNTLLLRPLPFQDPDRVLAVHIAQQSRGRFEGSWSYADWVDAGDGGGAFAATALFTNRTWNLGAVDEPERVNGSRVTASVFPLLGIAPQLGRNIRPEEERGGRVAMISDALWHRRFGGARDVLGRAVTVNGAPYAIVGVLPEGIRFPEDSDIYVPLDPTADEVSRRDWRGYRFLARLAPGVSVAEAQSRLEAITRRLAERYPGTNEGWVPWIEPYREIYGREVRPMMLILLGAVGFVLLIACANVANLLLARASGRQREIAVRLALGAGRGRIVRQLLTESILLGLIGGGVGTLLGAWGLEALLAQLPADLPFWMVFDVDRRVLAMTFGVSLLAGVVFGLAPALQASSPRLSEALKDTGRGATGTARAGRLRDALIVSEVALSLVLLVGAGLMIRSFLATARADLGFDPRNVLTFETSLQGDRYASDTVRYAFYRRMHERLATIPGVTAVGGVGELPVESCCNWTGYVPAGRAYPPGEGPMALHNVATPAFFAAMRTTLLAGRDFDERDVADAPPVVVVNRAFAAESWPGESAIGKTLRLVPDGKRTHTVVGVVENLVQDTDVADRDTPQLFVPYAQSEWRTLTNVVRAGGDPAALATAVRAAVAELDRDLPLAQLRTMPEVIRQRMFQSRLYPMMFATFAIAALLLASIGLYGVMSYSVAQRTHEIGVRMALGALPGDVLRLVVRHGAWLIGAGLLIGLPIAFALARLLQGMLYGVTPGDIVTFATIPPILGIVALVASYVPARRATRVDPVIALRND